MENDDDCSRIYQDDLIIKILELLCTKKDTHINLSQIRNIIPNLNLEEISKIIDEMKVRRVPIHFFKSQGNTSIKYRIGLEAYIFDFKRKTRNKKLHKAIEFLCKESDKKQSFEAVEITKVFNPELDISEAISLCEELIRDKCVKHLDTDQVEARDTIAVIVTPSTCRAYNEKKYLKEYQAYSVDQEASNFNPVIISSHEHASENKSKTLRGKIFRALPVPVILGLIVFGYNIIRNDKKDNEEYKVHALSLKPEIRVIKCVLSKYKMSVPSLEFTTEDFKKDTINKTLVRTDSVNFDVTFKNIGNCQADLLVGYSADTTSGQRFLDKFKTKKQFSEFVKTNKTSYYSSNHLSPQEEFVTHIKKEISNFKDEMFTLHLIVIYKNDLNAVYDTYYWYREKINDFTLEGYVNNKGQIVNQKYGSLNISAIDSSQEFHVYSRKESKKILEYFDNPEN